MADYFKKDSIGKAHVVGYLGFVIGEVISVRVLFVVTEHMKPTDSFFLVGVLTILISSSLLCMIREPRIRRKTSKLTDGSETEDSSE